MHARRAFLRGDFLISESPFLKGEIKRGIESLRLAYARHLPLKEEALLRNRCSAPPLKRGVFVAEPMLGTSP